MSLTAEQLEATEDLQALVSAAQTSADTEKLLALPVGMHHDVRESVYHARALGMASKSALDELRRSPAHYRAWVDGARDRETPALNLGKAAHCAVLEPERFAREYVIAPDFGDCRRRENKLARDAWTKEHRGSTILRNADGMVTLGMIRSLSQHPLVRRLFDGAEEELTLRWDDPATHLPCKARLDLFRRDLRAAVDVKSSNDASARAFQRDLWQYGYYRQDAFYRFGLAELGVTLEHFVFVVVEKAPPYAVSLYSVDADDIGRGHRENVALLEKMADCVARDEWNAYPETIQTLRLPAWAAEDRTW